MTDQTEDVQMVPAPETPSPTDDDGPITAESLIEEVSIDGMCGVY